MNKTSALDAVAKQQRLEELARFPAENPYPVLRLNRDGIVSYANQASGPLLHNWGVAMGALAPTFLRTQVREALADGELRRLDNENEVEGRLFSLEVVPIVDAGYADVFGTDITKKTAATAELTASELRYRRLFETAKDGILILDAETGMVVDVNPFLVKLLGFSRATFLGKKLWELGFFKDIVANQDHFAKLQQKGYIRYEDRPLETASGDRKDVEFVSNVYRVNHHKVIQCNIRDITARKLVETAKARSEAEFRAMFELASIGMAQADPRNGRWLRVNQKMCEITGYSNAELLQKHITELTYPADRQQDTEFFHQVVRGAAPDYRIEKRYLRKDGTVVWVNVNMTVIRDAAGQSVRTMATIEDITERKRAEESHARLMTAVHQSAEMILITDANGTTQYVNPALEKTTGYAREELVGQNPRILKSGKQNAEFYQRMWTMLTAGEVWRGRMINRRKDGTCYEDDASISPVRDATGKIVNYVAAMRDVTREVQLESQLRQAQKMEAVGRLAGGVAHDFNNLLMVIMGNVELCRDKMPADPPLRRYLDEITNASQKSADITRQLLAFARKQAIVPKVLDLNDAVAGMLNLLRRLIGEDIKLTWQPGAGVRPVSLDPSQIDQILANLCANARDAIVGVGTVILETGNITIDADYCERHAGAIPGTYVFLTVSDDGCGMDQETLAQVFEPFFTTKGLGKGTGLGLATVYGIVQQNNGFIYAYSEPGKGTSFKIYLPQAAAKVMETTAKGTAKTPKGRGETILVVEDDEALRLLCSHFLSNLGYKVLLAETPGDALRMADQHPGEIRLLLTDVVMPGMDGTQLAKRLASARSGLRVLLMSGYTAEVMAHRDVLSQGTAFIAKPFTRDDLGHKVREVLEK